MNTKSKSLKSSKSFSSRIIIGLISLFFLLIFLPVQGQDKKVLEKSKRKLENQIGYTRKLLNETSTKKKSSLNELSLINRQIKNRQELIEVYNKEIQNADYDLVRLRNQINELQKDLTKLKADYGLLVYQSYKTRNQTDQWMYIFSADDFYQAFNRIKYIKAIGETRKEAAARIYEKETSLQSQINRLENVKKDRLNLMTAKEQEAKSLISDKSHKEAAVTGIIKKEKELKQQLATQQKEWKKLNDEIKRIIEASMKKTTVTVKGKTTETKKIPLTPEETTLASNFAGNKGKLPWPSERGQIISSFGPHPHPQLHVTIDNKGIDIRTERGTKARAVYAGKVNRIIQIGKYKAILIQHGSYFTVYSNLSVVYVSENENVATKQVIGLIATSSDSDETILHFELWSSQTNTPLNPEYWINK